MKSIIQSEKRCYVSGQTSGLEKHHIFGGSRRKKSEQYGLWIWLTHEWHNEPPKGIHFDKNLRLEIQAMAQSKFEETHTREEFMQIFGRNYIET